MKISLGRAFSEALQITLRSRTLWVYGILLVIFGGQCSVPTSSFQGSEDQGQEFFNSIQRTGDGVILGLAIVVILVVLFFWLLSIVVGNWALGSLIGGISQSLPTGPAYRTGRQAGAVDGSTSFSASSRAGMRAWLKLVIIGFLSALSILLLISPLLGVVAIIFLTGQGVLALLLLLWLPLAFIGTLFIHLVATMAQIYAVLGETGVFGSISAGWRLIMRNMWDILVVWLANDVGVGCAAGCVTGAVAAASIIPAVIGFLINPAVGLALLAPGLIFLLLISLAVGVVKVFQKAIWVIAYRELTSPPIEEQEGPHGAI